MLISVVVGWVCSEKVVVGEKALSAWQARFCRLGRHVKASVASEEGAIVAALNDGGNCHK